MNGSWREAAAWKFAGSCCFAGVWLVEAWRSWGVTPGWTRCLVGPLRFEFGCVFRGIFATGVVLNDGIFTNLFALLVGELVGWALGEGSASWGVFISIPGTV